MEAPSEYPTRIGDYEIEKYLNQGATSQVFQARDPIIGKPVAIKILKKEVCADEEVKDRFLQEARLAAKMNHPNVVSVYSFGSERGRPYMVMELLEGEDLRQAIDKGHTGNLTTKLQLAKQIAGAIEYIHQFVICHRDIKPQNIFITANGNVKLIDFGIAKFEDFAITRPDGSSPGTPYYMAPEQIRGTAVTGLLDVYAFGALLFELLTGTKAAPGHTLDEIYSGILHAPIDIERLKQAGIPDSVCQLIRKTTAKTPSERIQSFREIRESLERILLTKTQYETRERHAKIGIVVFVVLLLLVALADRFLRIFEPGPVSPPSVPDVLHTSTGDMILVPAGSFKSGESKEVAVLPAFYIDQTEVTNRAFKSFCEATHRPFPEGLANAGPDYPVVNITITDAQDFAKWAGKRLPKMKEWEKAARGIDGSNYPWGDELDLTSANVADRKDMRGAPMKSALLPVGSIPAGASYWGIQDMVGNVAEFIEERSSPSSTAVEYFKDQLKPAPTDKEPWYLFMGGSYLDDLKFHVGKITYDATPVPARWGGVNLGFRCVRDLKP